MKSDLFGIDGQPLLWGKICRKPVLSWVFLSIAVFYQLPPRTVECIWWRQSNFKIIIPVVEPHHKDVYGQKASCEDQYECEDSEGDLSSCPHLKYEKIVSITPITGSAQTCYHEYTWQLVPVVVPRQWHILKLAPCNSQWASVRV